MKPVVILGATGTTGRHIARFLNAENIPLRLAARNQENLESFAQELGGDIDLRTLDIENRRSIESAIDESAMVANCVGPFTLYGEQVIKTCLEKGIDYLDITGEQHFIKHVIDSYRELSLEKSVFLVPSAAFEFCFGETAIRILAEEFEHLEEVEITYSFKNIATSRGTNNSVIAAMTSPSYHRVKNDESRIQPGKGVSRYSCAFPDVRARFPFPGGEVFLAPLHTQVQTIRTFLGSQNPSLITGGVSFMAMKLFNGRKMDTPLLKMLKSLIERSNQAIEESKQGKTAFLICAEARGKRAGEKEVTTKRLEIKGMNPYRLTAAIVCLVIKETISRDHSQNSSGGVISASMACGHEKIVELSQKYGVRWSGPDAKSRQGV